METPSCVVDAKTLVEHIQAIKRWVYHGQIHLVVPLSTLERVEQLYQDLKEKTVTIPEPTKKRSSGKPVRPEYPAFDINLVVAREFLSRLKLHNAEHPITFQQPSEEYSPWKGVEVQVEKKMSTEDGPTTWAQAAHAAANNKKPVNNVTETLKGPSRPKLVARIISAETSPWKTNKNAPRVPATEIPEALRSLFSYTLWRLYENIITQADTNPTILLSDNQELRNLAGKLNIATQQVRDFRETISAQHPVGDRNVFGDLERDYPDWKPKASLLQTETARGVSDVGVASIQSDDHAGTEAISPNVVEMNGTCQNVGNHEDEGVDTKKSDNVCEMSLPYYINDNILAYHNGSSAIFPQEQESKEEAGGSIDSNGFPTDGIVLHTQEFIPIEQPKQVIAREMKRAVTKKPEIPVNQANGLPDRQYQEGINTQPNMDIDPEPKTVSAPKRGSPLTTNDNALENVVSAQRHPNQRTKRNSQSLQSPMHPRTANNSASSSRQSSTVPSLAPTQAKPEVEDSDEEVIIFNPKSKRHSATQQRTPRRQYSPRRPSTAHARSQQPVPHLSTPIIDPNAFGRDFTTNLRGYVPNGGHQLRNSPRGSPRRGGGARVHDSEVEYVLRSGATREATRGQGKLWVP